MASAAFASLDAGSLCKLHGSHVQTNTSLKPREGLLTVRKFARRNGNALHHQSLSVSAMAEPAVSEELKVESIKDSRKATMLDMIEPQVFKITTLDKGGKKEWHPATVLTIQELASGVSCITVEAEVSREMVSLENAYSMPGQLAQVKVNGGKATKVATSCAPFATKANEPVLYKVRGDIPAGMTKQPQFFLSVKYPLELLVYKSETPRLFALKEGDPLEIGPFDYSGLDLRPIYFLTRYPTILFFASGKGIAVAKAIIEAKDADLASMTLGMRENIRLFYWSLEPSKVLFKDWFEKWENEKLKVRAAVRNMSNQDWDGHVGSFTSMWDEDDIEYDPSTTGVIVCIDSKSRAEVDELLADAGIPEKQIIRWEPQEIANVA